MKDIEALCSHLSTQASIYQVVAANPMYATGRAYMGVATAQYTSPQSMWDGDPGSVYTLGAGRQPGQCKGCGAPGTVGWECEYCGGKNIKEEQA